MNPRWAVSVVATCVALCCAAPAVGQTTTTTSGLTLQETLRNLTAVGGGQSIGEALSLSTALEVGTAPIGTSAGGFVFNLDPTTGLQARSTTTFGPSFAERALTSGEGKISVSTSFIFANYTKLGDISLDQMKLVTQVPGPALSGHGSFVVTSKTLAITGTIGVTDALDVAVSVPIVSVELDGATWLQDDSLRIPPVLSLAKGGGLSSGLGDIGAIIKYRLFKFDQNQPDPGGLAVIGVMHVPTGDRENLRGLGVTRTLIGGVYSSGRGRFRPHANFGYERWSSGLELRTLSAKGPTTVTVRDQVQFAAGVEVEAAPKLTLLVDLLGRYIRGAGSVEYRTIGSQNLPVMLPEGVRKLALAPGLKLNLKGKVLLALNCLVSLYDNGLHASFTPVVGLDISM